MPMRAAAAAFALAAGLPASLAILTAGAKAQTASGPSKSAYEGTVGDWALGRWTGYLYPNYGNIRLTTEDRIMIIERLADGKVGCRWAIPKDLPRVGWAPRCVIDGQSISLVTTADSEVKLTRNGAELEGTMLSRTSTRYRANLKRE